MALQYTFVARRVGLYGSSLLEEVASKMREHGHYADLRSRNAHAPSSAYLFFEKLWLSFPISTAGSLPSRYNQYDLLDR